MAAYAHCPTLGLACSTAALKYGCRCHVCGRWYAAHLVQRREGRPAKVIHEASPTCPVHGCKASTAYAKLKCRCESCRGWNTARERRRKTQLKEARWEKLWTAFMQRFATDDELLIHMVEESAKVARKLELREQRRQRRERV